MKTEPNDPQSQTVSSSTERSNMNTPRKLKWYQVVIILSVASFLCYTNYIGNSRHKQEIARNQAILARIAPENVKGIIVRLWKCCGDEKPVTLDQNDCDELAKYISKMTPTDHIGGEAWQYYRGIDIDAGAVGQFRIVLMTRDSLNEHVLADFQIADGPKTTTTLYYDADELWNWLKKLPVIAQQEDSTGSNMR